MGTRALAPNTSSRRL